MVDVIIFISLNLVQVECFSTTSLALSDVSAIFSTGPESGEGCHGFERLDEKENGVP